jgi:hypothetical protein
MKGQAMAEYFLATERKDMGGTIAEYDLAINLDAIAYVRFHSAQTDVNGERSTVRTASVYLNGLATPEFSLTEKEAARLEQVLRQHGKRT